MQVIKKKTGDGYVYGDAHVYGNAHVYGDGYGNGYGDGYGYGNGNVGPWSLDCFPEVIPVLAACGFDIDLATATKLEAVSCRC